MSTTPLMTPHDIEISSGGNILASDPRTVMLLDNVTASLRRYCGWHIAPEITETITLDGKGGKFLKLPTLHCREVSELKINGETVRSGAYGVSKLGLIELYAGRFPNRYGSIEVTFTHGFDEAPDVAQVVSQVVANAYSSPMGVTREQAGGVSINWSTTAPGVSGGVSLLARDIELVNQYRLEGL